MAFKSNVEKAMHEVAVANRILAEFGLASGITASLGHASMRLADDSEHFAVKGRGQEFDALIVTKDEDIVICDLGCAKIDGARNLTPCTEVQLHACIYKTRPDVQAVVHVHPRFTVLASVLQKDIVPMCREGAETVNKDLPVYPHAKLVRSEKDGMEVAETMGSGNIVLLEGHGAVTSASTLRQAVLTMYQLEEQARMNWYALCAAGRDHRRISEELLAEGRSPQSPAQGNTRGTADSGVWAYQTRLIELKMAAESE